MARGEASGQPAMRGDSPRRSRGKILIFSVLLLLLIGCGVLAYLVFYGDLCRIEGVELSGNQNLSSEYLMEVSGVKAYNNLATIPVRRIQSNLLTEAWIEKVVITRDFPHTLKIRIDERVPVAMIEYGATGFVVDARGFTITGSPTDQYPALVRIHGMESQPPEVGKVIADTAIMSGLEIISALPKDVSNTLTVMNPFDPKGIICATSLGYNILFGDNTEVERKRNVLIAILKDIRENQRSISYIDLSVPEAPVIKPKE